MFLSRLSLKPFLLFSFFSLSFFSFSVAQFCDDGELMQQAFCPSKNASTVVDRWNTPDAVGNRVLKWGNVAGIEVSTKEGVDLSFDQKAPLLAQIVRFFLILTIVISVTMIIVNGILYITKSGQWEDPSKMRRNLFYIILGILVALASVSIITLFQSAGNDLEEIVKTPVVSDAE